MRMATARINYKGEPHQLVLDITVKGKNMPGFYFAPTWDMVKQFKRGEISWEQYTTLYTNWMRLQYTFGREKFLDILNHDDVVLCCYCKDASLTTRQCHRYLLVGIFEKVAKQFGIPFEYAGEVK